MAKTVICAGCSKPIQPGDEHTIINVSKHGEKENFLCPECHAALQNILDRRTQALDIPLTFIMLGCIAAAGLIWYALAGRRRESE